MVTFSLSLSACGRQADNNYKFEKHGIYDVTETLTGISFKARFSAEQRELSFRSPEVINGLSAVSADGNVFSLSYRGINVTVGSFAVKTAGDFFAALELLDEAGTRTAIGIEAEVEGISASARIENGTITEIRFNDGLNTRNYKITTEATGWKTVQKLG